jgi:hypothetical protein
VLSSFGLCVRGEKMLTRKFGQRAEGEVGTTERPQASTGAALDRLKRLAAQRSAAAESAHAAPRADGRRAPRKSSILGGIITSPSMVAERPCKVVDMSATGARVRLTPTSDHTRGLPASVPDTFTLVLRIDRLEVDCEVAWRKDREIGVRFLGVVRPIAKGR